MPAFQHDAGVLDTHLGQVCSPGFECRAVGHRQGQMVQALATLGIGLRAGGGSSKGAILTRLAFAEIAVDEAG